MRAVVVVEGVVVVANLTVTREEAGGRHGDSKLDTMGDGDNSR
jgi:hypothetical protein